MRLSEKEFQMMNNPVKDFLQKHVEFNILRMLGLRDRNKDILEIGCGSGFGAELLSQLKPAAYTGIDLMPEQIELACSRGMKNVDFLLMNAADLGFFSDASRDITVVFRIFHHMPEWRESVKEVFRVLRPGGKFFVVEPIKLVTLASMFTSMFHPREAIFSGGEFSAELKRAGFIVRRRISILGFNFFYAQRPCM